MKIAKWLATTLVGAALAGTAQAGLIDRGGGLIYDTTRNITWLADMNYASTSGHTGTGVNANGTMTWTAAMAWANNLVFGGYSDWRLPTLNPADTSCSDSFDPGGGFPLQYAGDNCAGGELTGLFVTDLGNKGSESIENQAGDTPEQIANLALFSNVRVEVYWSGTEYAPNPGSAWYFRDFDGLQYFHDKGVALYAVAVRPGDVIPSASVPEPQSLALLLLGLTAGMVARRRRTR